MAKEYIIFDDEDIRKLTKGETLTVKQKNGEDLHFKYKPVMTAQRTVPMTIQVQQPIEVNRSLESITEQMRESMMKSMRRQSNMNSF